MLTGKRHTGVTHIDAVDEARERRCKSDDKCDDRTPVCGKLGRVAVDAIELVHIRYRHVAATSDVVALNLLTYCGVLLKH